MIIGLRQAAQQALNALDEATTYTGSPSWSPSMTDECIAAASALRAALSQQPDNTACKSVQKRLEAQQPATGEPTPQDVVDAFEKARAGSDKPVGILRGVRAVMRLLPDLKPAPDPIAPATGEPVVVQHRKPVIGWKGEAIGYTAWRDGKGLDGWPHRELYDRPAPSVPKDHQIAALVNKVRDIARMFHDHQSLRERIAIELVPALKASQEVKSNAERWRYAIADGGNQSMNFIDIFDDWDGDGSFVEAFDKARLADKKEGSAA